jgi:hypothetical protein
MLNLLASAASSDMAQPIIVAGATTESCAAVGPRVVHGARPYSRTAGPVKRAICETQAKRASVSWDLEHADQPAVTSRAVPCVAVMLW